MISTWPHPLLVLASIAVIALVACGGDDDEVTASPTTDVAVTPSSTVAIATSTIGATTVPTATLVPPTPTVTPVPPAPTATPFPTATLTPVLGVDLAVNGSFENGATDPDNWTFFAGDPLNVRWITSNANTGQRALKLTSPSNDQQIAEIQAAVPLILEKGKTYQIAAFVRTDQQVAFSLGMSWFEDDGQTPAGAATKPFNNFVSTEWTQIFVTADGSTFPFYDDPSIGAISLNIHSQQDVAPADVMEFTLYIDDITFREIIE